MVVAQLILLSQKKSFFIVFYSKKILFIKHNMRSIKTQKQSLYNFHSGYVHSAAQYSMKQPESTC